MSKDRPLDDTRAWLCLLRAPGLGASTARGLVVRAGGAAAALADIERLRMEFALADTALAALRVPDIARIEADLAWLAAPDHHLVTWTDADYPPLLREIGAAPAALFVVGDPTLLWLPQLAMVGARSSGG